MNKRLPIFFALFALSVFAYADHNIYNAKVDGVYYYISTKDKTATVVPDASYVGINSYPT